MKKLFALLLAVVLVLGLVACVQEPAGTTTGNNPTTTVGGNNSTTTSTAAGEGVTFPLKEEITIKMLCNNTNADYKDWNATLQNNKLWQDVYKATNIKVEVVTCADVETLNGMIQSGSYGDIIAVNGVTDLSKDANINQLIASDRLLDINEYIDVMPNFQKQVMAEEPLAKGAFTSPDGGLYVLGFYSAERSSYLESTCWINKTWLDKAGMTVKDVSTMAGLEKFFAYVTENDMNGNGDKTDELAWYCYPLGGSMIEALLGCWGLPTKDDANESYITIEDDEVLYVPQTDAYKDFLTVMNRWYAAGYLTEGYFDGHTKDFDEWTGEMYRRNNGQIDRVAFQIGATAPARYTSKGTEGDLHPQKGTADRCEYISILPPTVEGYTTQWYLHPGYIGTKNACAVAANTQYPAEVCAWLDLFYSEEYTVRSKFGDEGSQWRVTDDEGKLSLRGSLSKDQISIMINDYKDDALSRLCNFLPYSLTKNILDNIQTTTPTVQAKRDALAVYEDAGVINKEVWPRPYLSDEANTELSEIRGDIATLTSLYRAEAITGAKNLTTDWEAFKADLVKADIETYIEVFQAAWDNYVAGQE